MAYVRRRIRRRRTASMSTWFRARMLGFLFLGLAVVVVGAITYLTSIIPSNYIIISNNSISVSTSVPQGATGLDSKLIIGIMGWGIGVLLFLSGIRRVGGLRL